MNSIQLCRAARLALCAVIATLAICTATEAATIPLFNTGTNNSNVATGPNLNDQHYDLIFPPNLFNTEVTVIDGQFPIGPWVLNNANSRWIGPSSNGNGNSGTYRYRTTFNLPANANLSTASITGLWSTDDQSVDIFINGNPTSNSTGGHNALWPFSVNTGFQVGLNTLDFELINGPQGSPTGLRVDGIQGTYLLIPEPATVGLIVIGLVGVCGTIRRRRAAHAALS